MKSLLKEAFKTSLPVMAAYWFIGMGYGLYAHGAGAAWWFPLATAAFVYTGSVEFLLAAAATGAFSAVDTFAMAFLVGARHIFYSVAMLERFAGVPWRKRFFMIYLLSDETFAVTLPKPAAMPGFATFQLAVSAMDWTYWVTGTLAGVLLAGFLDPSLLKGADFIMTAMFAAIFAENWCNERNHSASCIGLAAGLGALVLFGADAFMIPAMLAILALLAAARRHLP
ncbi:MAG: AzlC family ABC transporter permease [Kiritimatiellae bacterium]|nr:AzlC family ABC transporter permease [Kiritimatiellia bacterium]